MIAVWTCVALAGAFVAGCNGSGDGGSPKPVRLIEKLPPAAETVAEVTAALPALAGAIDALGRTGRVQADDLAWVELQKEKADLLLSRYAASDFRDAQAVATYGEARAGVEKLARGERLSYGAKGRIERAYRSEVDGSVQPYIVVVPEGIAKDRKPALLVFLHGYVPEFDKVNWVDMSLPTELETLAGKAGAVAALPYARGNTDFQAVGESDVMKVMRLVRAQYGTDPDRTYLAGISMGGGGVWSIGCHYPDEWAALVPISGRTDYNLWKGIDPAAYPAYKDFFNKVDFASSFPENVSNVPTMVFHGFLDWLVKVEQSRSMVERLKALGADVTLIEFPDGFHNDMWARAVGDPRLARWLAGRTRTRFPRWIGYKTFSPEYAKAWWISIERFERFGRPARVEATVEKDRTVRVATENVAEVALDVAALERELGGEVTIEINGKPAPLADGPRPGWKTAALSPPADSRFRKTARVAGPFREVFDGPFMIVVGTGGPEEDARRAAMNAAAAAEDWRRFGQGRARMKADTEVTADDIAHCNLFLFGTPETNQLIARIAESLPVRPEGANFRVGTKLLAAEGLGLLVIYPNPLNPERYVAVESGAHWGAGQVWNHRWDWIGDFVVYTAEPEDDGTNKSLVAGYFDENWRLADDLTWWTEEGKARAAGAAAAAARPGAPEPGEGTR